MREISSREVPATIGSSTSSLEASEIHERIKTLTAERNSKKTELDGLTAQLGQLGNNKEASVQKQRARIDRKIKRVRLDLQVLEENLEQAQLASNRIQLNLSAGPTLNSADSVSTSSSSSSSSEVKGVLKERKSQPIMISMFNHKGGVGKTTASYHIGERLSALGFKVLLVDCDPQATLKAYIHPEYSTDFKKAQEAQEKLTKQRLEHNRYSELDRIFQESIYSQRPDVTPISRANETYPLPVHDYERLFYLPGSIRISRLEKPIAMALGGLNLVNRYGTMVPDMLLEIGRVHGFDFVLVDLNPGISALNQSVIMRSHYLFMPFKPDVGSLEAYNNMVEVMPEWFNDMRSPSNGYLKENEGPLYLGTFPMMMKTRHKRKSPVIVLEEAYREPIQRIFQASERLLGVFKKYMPQQQMDIPSDTYKQLVGIVEMAGAGINAQWSGRPMTDLKYEHEKMKGGKKVKFDSKDIEKKLQIWNGYRKVIGTHFKFLTKAHQQILSERVPDFLRSLNIWSTIDQQFETEDDSVVILSSTSSLSQPSIVGDQHWYNNDEIEVLMDHYLRDRENVYFTTPMSGDGAFGNEDLAHQIEEYLSRHVVTRIREENREGNATIFIPLNIGVLIDTERNKSGNHWVLAVVTANRTGVQEVFYVDPYGREMLATTSNALKQGINNAFNSQIEHITSMNLRLQTKSDGHNCGSWVVEIARCSAAGQDFQTLFGVNIAERRAQHNTITNYQPEMKPAGATSKKNKKKRKAEEKIEGSRPKENKNAATASGWNPGMWRPASSSSSQVINSPSSQVSMEDESIRPRPLSSLSSSVTTARSAQRRDPAANGEESAPRSNAPGKS